MLNARNENKRSQSYNYDARGNITGIIDGNGNETKYILDDWGRITQIETAEGNVEKYEYDYAGNIISTTDCSRNTIQYKYNSLNLVSEIIDQQGESEYFYYDEEGNLSKYIDRNKNNVDRKYNIDKNIVQVKAYKLDEEAIKKEQEEKNKTSKRHTDYYMMVLNQIEAKKAQNNRNLNLEEEVTDDKNKLNIVEQRYKYNNDGTLRNGYFNNMEYQYKYNLEGILESKSASGKTLLSYTYDKNNNIKTIKDISGTSSVYYYDENNRLKNIKDEKASLLAEYNYYNNDAIKSVKLGNGVKSDYTYDGDGNVKSLVTIGANGQLLLDYKYAYDLNGNRIEKIGSKHKNYYSYDSMNRLKETTYDNRSENFTYDKAGNRLTKTTEGIVEKYKYNAKNQLKEISKNNEKTLFTYDKQGNTIKEETNKGNNIFEYNTLNQQIKAVTKEGNTLVNRYDSEGLRYEIEENEKLTRFIFNKNGDILTETDSNDNIVSRFTRGYEIVSADIKSNSPTNCNLKGTFENDDLEKYFYTTDEQGSTALITNQKAGISNEYYYDAFGNVLESKEDVHNRITYTGQQYDQITNQYYLRARFYNPKVGRFTQEDIYRGDGLNLYDYCRSNPVKYYDPSGYTKCPASKEIQLNTKGVSNARIADDILDKELLGNVNIMKDKLPSWAKNKGNFGYSEANIEGIDKTGYFAHSSIQTEIPSVKGSGISVKTESSPFKATEVNGDNIVNGEGAWSRDVDTEYKMLSDIQSRLGDNYNASGTIKLYTELEPCPSCRSVIEQFKQMYPNIDVEVVYSVKK